MAGIVDLLGPDAFRETVADAMIIVENTRGSESSSLLEASSTSFSWIFDPQANKGENGFFFMRIPNIWSEFASRQLIAYAHHLPLCLAFICLIYFLGYAYLEFWMHHNTYDTYSIIIAQDIDDP